MKHNRIKPSGNIEADVVKAIKRFAREEYGVQPTRMTKNKKKYDRKVEKNKLLRDSEAYFLYRQQLKLPPET